MVYFLEVSIADSTMLEETTSTEGYACAEEGGRIIRNA